MSDDTNAAQAAASSSNTASTPTAATTAAKTAAAKTAAPAAAASGGAPGTFGSIGALKAQNPDFWKAFEMGVAQNICSEMEKHQAKLKEINRKARQDLGQT